MKTNTILGSEIDDIVSGDSVKMSIDSNSIDHLMLNLTNLYADPVLAVVREYVSNAYDSHIRAGQSQPVQVWLPNNETQVFTVEDFGVGMSKQEIVDIYSKYGLSTKNNTNSEIGAFGLGAKSALAIADRFDIVARKNGVETVAYVQKNSKGVGVVHFVSETETTQPDGFKVSVPVSDYSKISEFNRKQRFFDTWKPGLIVVNGEATLAKQYQPGWLTVNPDGDDEPVGWFKINTTPVPYRAGQRYYSPVTLFEKVSFIIGGIPYEFPRQSENSSLSSTIYENKELKEKLSNVLTYDGEIVINLPIGSVDLTPNRESIMINEKSAVTFASLITDFVDNVEVSARNLVNTLGETEALSFVANNFSLFKVEESVPYSPYRSGSLFEAAAGRDEYSGVFWQGEPIPTWLDCGEEPVSVLISTSGLSLKEWNRHRILPILNAFNRNNGEHLNIIVKTDSVNETVVRNYLRDYAKSVTGGTDIIVVLSDSEEVLNNEWVKATYRVVSFDDFMSSAKQFRRDRKSSAQAGVKRSSVGYAVVDYSNSFSGKVTADVEYVTSDVFPNDGEGLVYLPISQYTWWGNRSDINLNATNVDDVVANVVRNKRAETVTLAGFLTNIEPAVRGRKVVLLNKTKKPEAFKKKYSQAENLTEAFSRVVKETVKKDRKSKAEMNTLISLLYKPQEGSGRFHLQSEMVDPIKEVFPHFDGKTNPELYRSFQHIAEDTELFNTARMFALVASNADKYLDNVFNIATADSLYEKLSVMSFSPSRFSAYGKTMEKNVIRQFLILCANV